MENCEYINDKIVSGNQTQNKLDTHLSVVRELQSLKDTHAIWTNPLLTVCINGELTLEDYQYIFSQYYFYSKNFTKLIAAAFISCDSDYYRSQLTQNLWEESGEKDINLRHAEVFRKFLTSALHLDLDNIQIESYSKHFFEQYLNLCLYSNPIECTAILVYATEGIVRKLYSMFKKGLMKIGLIEETLTFFNMHIECDDSHAVTLEKMFLFHFSGKQNHNIEEYKNIVNKALDLRSIFFTNIYNNLILRRFDPLFRNISHPHINKLNFDPTSIVKKDIYFIGNKLYHNTDIGNNINFTVDRIPFDCDVLDPRLVNIPAGFTNELHHHAHETIFLILEGMGEVHLNNNIIPIKAGDIVYVPRWVKHQTKNSGKTELKFFAVTDYGFTKRLPQNSEIVYRKNKQNTLLGNKITETYSAI